MHPSQIPAALAILKAARAMKLVENLEAGPEAGSSVTPVEVLKSAIAHRSDMVRSESLTRVPPWFILTKLMSSLHTSEDKQELPQNNKTACI